LTNGQSQFTAIEKIYNTNNKKLEIFFNDSQKTLDSLGEQLQQLQQDLNNFKVTLDESMRKLEMDVSKNDGMLANIVAGSNLKLKKEKVSQKRMALLQILKNITNDFQTFQKDFNQTCKNLTNNWQKLNQDFADLKKDISNAFNNIQNQFNQQQLSQQPQQAGTSSLQGQTQQNNQSIFQQAENQLQQAQQVLKNNQIISQVNRLRSMSEDNRFKH